MTFPEPVDPDREPIVRHVSGILLLAVGLVVAACGEEDRMGPAADGPHPDGTLAVSTSTQGRRSRPGWICADRRRQGEHCSRSQRYEGDSSGVRPAPVAIAWCGRSVRDCAARCALRRGSVAGHYCDHVRGPLPISPTRNSRGLPNHGSNNRQRIGIHPILRLVHPFWRLGLRWRLGLAGCRRPERSLNCRG